MIADLTAASVAKPCGAGMMTMIITTLKRRWGGGGGVKRGKRYKGVHAAV